MLPYVFSEFVMMKMYVPTLIATNIQSNFGRYFQKKVIQGNIIIAEFLVRVEYFLACKVS